MVDRVVSRILDIELSRGTSPTEVSELAGYEGQQVKPRQALALIGTRGFVAKHEEGITKTFHDIGLIASIQMMEGYYTAAEIEGFTLESVSFYKRERYKPVKLEEVPPRIFSEVMRDVDLMVSVAHRGDVNPEASASTVELREAIARETCELLGLDNVSFANKRAEIQGELANYSIHLGSGTILRNPGGMIFIVPVHAQHRGRLFLPFADDDPKSAEILSKIILLARDREVKDPWILEQLK